MPPPTFQPPRCRSNYHPSILSAMSVSTPPPIFPPPHCRLNFYPNILSAMSD
ncbi:hypothetical protein ACHAW6_003383 [Cyclotella cf. meneghiniana]